MVLMNQITGKEWRHRFREQTYGHGGGGIEWDERRKRHRHIYTIRCKMDSWWEVAVERGDPSLVLCDDLEGWDMGRGERLIRIVV